MNSDQTDVQKYIPNGTRLFHTMAYIQKQGTHCNQFTRYRPLLFFSHISQIGTLPLVPLIKLHHERTKTFLHETYGMSPILRT